MSTQDTLAPETPILRYTRIMADRPVKGLEIGKHVSLPRSQDGRYVRPVGTERWAVARLTPADDECWESDAQTVAAVRAELAGEDEAGVWAAAERATTTTLGSHLRSLREERGWSQTELAERIGWAQSRISEYESGRRTPNMEAGLALARALDVSLDVLVGRE